MSYAQGTTVDVGRTQSEIERLLARFGATEFARGWSTHSGAVLAFRVAGRHVRMALPLPLPDDPIYARTPTGKLRTARATSVIYDAEVRRRWRALLAVIKAKLVAVEEGISTIEREFFADIVLPDGTTLGEWAAPQIEQAYATAQMPALLPGSGDR